MLAGFFFPREEIENLKVFKLTGDCKIEEKKVPSCNHCPLEVYQRGYPLYCQDCGTRNEIITVKEWSGLKRELIGYGKFYRSKSENSNCGCYDCTECTFTKCPDCTVCPCRDCKKMPREYPDLCDPFHYDEIYQCTCNDTNCNCLEYFPENYISGFYLKDNLKLFYTGKTVRNPETRKDGDGKDGKDGEDGKGSDYKQSDFGIFFKYSNKKIALDEDYLNFLTKIDQLVYDTGIKGTHEIRKVIL